MCANRFGSHLDTSSVTPGSASTSMGNSAEKDDATAWLNALLNAAVDAIIVIDHSGKMELVNAAAEKMFGYRKDDLLNNNVCMLLPAHDWQELKRYLHHHLETGEAHIEDQVTGIERKTQAEKKSGEIFPIAVSVGEVRDSSHRQFIGIIRDISAQVKAENDAQESRERLAHIERLSTMGEMATGIAHEINQPLTAVATYAQACCHLLTKETFSDPDKQQLLTTLEKISEQTFRAAEVIRHLRNFVKKRSAIREEVNLNSLIHDTVTMAKTDSRLSRYGIALTFPEEPTITISADPVQIQQVLLNLIRNAVDAVADSQTDKPITVQTQWINKNTIQVAVIDSGHGVDERSQSSLFTPFYTTKETGMGMGLAISQSLITSHGGTLRYQRKKTDSIFSFTLPATASPLNQSSEDDV